MFHSGVGDTRTCMPTLVYRCTSILVQYLQSHASGCLPERELLLAQWGARDCLQRTRTRVWQRGMPEVAQNLDLKKIFCSYSRTQKMQKSLLAYRFFHCERLSYINRTISH